MDKFKTYVAEQDYPQVRKHLKKVGKGGTVHYTHPEHGKVAGEYGGLMNRGGRSYAKVHHKEGPMKNTMSMVPLPQVHHG